MINNKRFNELLLNSRPFDVQHTKLLKNNYVDPNVLLILTNYFVSYINYFDLSDKQISDKHMEFLNDYILHLIEFEETNKYPVENKVSPKKDRLDYDVSLLCSTFLSYQRYLIFETLHNKINVENNETVLVVGVGPGIELAILNDKTKNIFAYDTDIGDFIKKTFPDVHFSEKYFAYEPGISFDKIILIELLEHLEKPEHLLIDVMRSLKPNGRIHFTTAVNIPQFDHLYNFELNDANLENCILNNGFEIEHKLDIPHNYEVNVNAYNCYYIIKKENDQISAQ
jgi:2-polyprenyl-3-methyl-5-hydroxy-6-metoxy-1,4-benzoquinol methylase